MELIDLVNSVIIFLSQITLIRWLTFLAWSLTLNSHTHVLLDFFLSIASIYFTMVFPGMENFDLVVSVSIDFLSNSKWDAQLHHCIAYNYYWADWDFLLLTIWKMFHVPSLNSLASGFRLELMYISVIANISLSLIHGLQLHVQLPQFMEITFFVLTNIINFLNLK